MPVSRIRLVDSDALAVIRVRLSDPRLFNPRAVVPVGSCSKKWRVDDAAQAADLGDKVRNLLPVGFVSRCLYAQSAAVISRPIAHFGAPLLMG